MFLSSFHEFFTDASGNGQVDSPNSTLQGLSLQTARNAHDEEEAITEHASDKFQNHNPLGVGADKHGEEHSHKHCCFKSCSAGHCTPISNPTQNGKDQEHRKTSYKATANLSMIVY